MTVLKKDDFLCRGWKFDRTNIMTLDGKSYESYSYYLDLIAEYDRKLFLIHRPSDNNRVFIKCFVYGYPHLHADKRIVREEILLDVCVPSIDDLDHIMKLVFGSVKYEYILNKR